MLLALRGGAANNDNNTSIGGGERAQLPEETCEMNLGVRSIGQCTEGTLLTANTSPREDVAVLITAKNARGPS